MSGVLTWVLIVALALECGGGDHGTDDDAGDDSSGDDSSDDAGDDASDDTADDTSDDTSDDTGDDTSDDAGDDTSDDTGDDTSDDTGDDDTGSGAPTYPSNHDSSWDCYICHETDFNGAPGEPHGHAYNAPTDCVGCHEMGDWVNDPSGPSAMNRLLNCLTCHSGQHGKTWQDKSQCRVCHQ